ncbi:hypothetical protein C7M84_001061 [Penaeus vannamei]|uniref:Uncharacterized protein n=1 Tax=Penaeus vannamei TaxID=6689 RepID=A0A3R7PAL1_PENVA|nr:hypothetical protein C7M84_001061 [Penaeus vannamei]
MSSTAATLAVLALLAAANVDALTCPPCNNVRCASPETYDCPDREVVPKTCGCCFECSKIHSPHSSPIASSFVTTSSTFFSTHLSSFHSSTQFSPSILVIYSFPHLPPPSYSSKGSPAEGASASWAPVPPTWYAIPQGTEVEPA